MTTPNPPVMLTRRRDAGINDYPIAALERRIALS